MAKMQLSWDYLVPSGDAAHVSRLNYFEGYRVGLHSHDFAEVFWVERGAVLHRLGSESSGQKFKEGSLVMIHPMTSHSLGHGGQEGPTTLVNIAFPFSILQETLGELRQKDGFEMPRPDRPWVRRLSTRALGHLHAWPQRLTRIRPHPHHMKAFLLDLFMLLEEEELDNNSSWPLWFSRSLREMDSPEGLREGLSVLVRTSGKSREHLSREFKRWVGMSPVKWLQKARVRWAAQALRLENRSVTEVANDVGLSNLGHFYRIFKEELGCTPREHRLLHRAQGSESLR